uniref:AHNAK nucleoprotein n=1 Tax=Xiphophorus couchianus TaxID=32473 RepID=A0A3B5LPZ9_9TELE
MPRIDLSLPRGKKHGNIDIDIHSGVDGNFEILSGDTKLPKGKGKFGVNIKGPEGKAGKLTMPKSKVSAPKLDVPDVKVQGPDIKGKIEMPAVDISPPEGAIEGDLDIDGHGAKGAKFHMPSLNINLPKIKSREAGIDVKGPKGEGKTFDVPSMDISAPKIKTPEVDVSLQGPDVDISLPKPKADFEIDVKDAEIKGGKTKIPTFDISMPKVNFPEAKEPQANLKGPEIDVDIKGPDVKGGTGGKFHMPTLDINMPKFDLDLGLPSGSKDKGLKVDISGPDASGDLEMSGLKGNLKPAQLKVRTEDVEGPGASLKLPSVELPTVDISAPKVDLDFGLNKPKGDDVEVELLKAEGGRPSSVEFDGDGKVKMKKAKIKMPSFGISKKDTDVSVSLKFPKFKMSSPKVQLPEGEVDAKGEAEVDRKSGFHAPDVTLKLPKFSIPGFGSKEKDLGKPSGELKVQGKVKMPSVELSLPEAKTPEMEVLLPKTEVDVSEADIKGKSQEIEGSGMELKGEGDGGTFKMPYVKMPTVDITVPKADISLPKAKLETPEIEIEGTTEQKFKMPRVDISLPKGKLQGNEAAEMDGERGKIKMPHIKMPHVDISLPKGKIEGKVEGPNVQIEGTSEDKVKLPQYKMPNVEVVLPKGQIEGPDVELKREKGTFKMPQIGIPSVEITLPKGKVEGLDIEGDGGAKFKTPYVKLPSVDTSVSKGKTADPNAGITGNLGGKFKVPHVKMPNVDFSVNKGKACPDVEIEGEGGKLKMLHFSMPSVDISLPKGRIESPDIEKGDTEGKIKMPHLKKPNVDISLPKGNAAKFEGTELKVEGSLPEVAAGDISLPKDKTACPNTGVKSEGGKFKLPKVDISLPKVKPSMEAPEMDIKKEGQLKMPKTSTDKSSGKTEVEGGTIKLPHIKMPEVDISLPKGKGSEVPTMEMEVTGPDAKLAKGKISMPKDKIPKPEPGLQVVTPDLKADLNVEGESKGIKLKMPIIDIESPKEELNIEFQKGDVKMDKKKIVLPDLDLNTSGADSKVKKGKKGKKFKIEVPKMKGVEDVTAEVKHSGDGGVKNNGHATDKCQVNITAPEVTLPSISLKTGSGTKGGLSSSSKEVKVPRIPDIEFDIGTSQDEDDDKTETEKKVKIPKFGVPLPSISSPEGRMDIHGPEIRYEGPKMPKVKKAVFVLVNPNEIEQASASITPPNKKTEAETETEDVKVKMPKIKKKSSFGKSKDKSSEREAEEEEKSKGAKIKIPKVSFSSGKSGSADVTLKGDSSSLNGEKAETHHKDDKGTFGGKIKLPKVEFTSPYSKMASGDKMGKDSSSEVKGDRQGAETPDKMASKEVVSSHARTEMLDRDSSESPLGFGAEFTSTKVQKWSKVESRSKEGEEKESTSWFKVPKFTLKPHATGRNRPTSNDHS